ncbi:MAG TPA: hypothetical protein VJU86_10175 [Pyrinomonadaceae bacterium]|nr:hypothetical protein [Pyrinomonadaceae bacterium]
MAKDERDILEVLKEELDFIEKGGYGRSVRTPWKPREIFQESLTCINFADPNHSHPCSECHLADFVPPDHLRDEVPCHAIPITEEGQTIIDLELEDNESKLERETKEWLRARIAQIEEERRNKMAMR